MYEQNPDVFMRFRKIFPHHICFEEQCKGKAFGNDFVLLLVYTEESENCDIKQKHYHLQESSSRLQQRGKGYAVPSLYSTF